MKKRGVNEFKGDTPAKKRARLEAWFTARDILGEKVFEEGTCLVLAGREGGDISVALGLGVRARRILAVERIAEAAADVQAKFPRVAVATGDLLDVLHMNRELQRFTQFDTVFLDLCTQLTEPVLDDAALVVLEGLRAGGAFLCTFLAGREQLGTGGTWKKVESLQNKLKEELKAASAETQKEWRDALPYLSRWHLLHQELNERLARYGGAMQAVAAIFYISKGEGEYKGMPMVTYVGKYGDDSKEVSTPPEFYFFTTTEQELGPLAVELEKLGYDASMLLNEPKGRVTAWKAHASRGEKKYKKT